MSDTIRDTIRYARLPMSCRPLRLAQFPAFAELAAGLQSEGGEFVAERMAANRGWIIQGPPRDGVNASMALLKALLLNGYSGLWRWGFGPELLATPEDESMAWPDEAKVWAFGRVFDMGLPAYPYTLQQRFDVENRLLQDLCDHVPVIHCYGRLEDCTWYSTELIARLFDQCEVVSL